MSLLARGLAFAFLVVFAGAGAAFAQARGELAPLAAWVAKGQQQARIDGKVAKALGLDDDGRPLATIAVTTGYLDGARIVHLLRGPAGERIVFAQGKDTQGTWLLTDRGGALLRAVEWVPTSANPSPAHPAAVRALFAETKSFWKNQLGRPVR